LKRKVHNHRGSLRVLFGKDSEKRLREKKKPSKPMPKPKKKKKT